MSIPVVPAIIPESLTSLRELLQQLTFAREVQLDVVDGKYTSSVSWPYIPSGTPREIKHITDTFTLEVDLMVADPLPAAQAWIEAGADMIIFHHTTISFEAFAAFVAQSPVSVGIATHGSFDPAIFFPFAAVADYVQLMGIKTIGAQKQPFDESVLERVEMIRREFPTKLVSVDGSVNEMTARRLARAGVNRLIVGSAIMQQADKEAAYMKLSSLVNG